MYVQEIFEIPGRRPLQNSQLWKDPKSQNLQVCFLSDFEVKEVKHALHNHPNKLIPKF